MAEETVSKEAFAQCEQIVGQLHPVIVNQDDKILDGFHRMESNPNWHKKVVQTKNRIEEILVRIHAHHRRRVPQEETKALLIELAQELEKSGIECRNISAELVKQTTYSERYIQMLLPAKYKQPEKVEAGKVGAEVVQQKRLSSMPTPSKLVECERCHSRVGKENIRVWHGHNLCDKCEVKANFNPEVYDGYFKYLERAKEGKIPEALKPKPFKPQEKWEDRVERMKVSPSKMDEAMLVRLQNNEKLRDAGWRVEFQKRYVKVLCVSDASLINDKLAKEIACFWDHKETHKDRQLEDEANRAEAGFIHNFEPLSLPYHAFTETEMARLEREVEKKAGV